MTFNADLQKIFLFGLTRNRMMISKMNQELPRERIASTTSKREKTSLRTYPFYDSEGGMNLLSVQSRRSIGVGLIDVDTDEVDFRDSKHRQGLKNEREDRDKDEEDRNHSYHFGHRRRTWLLEDLPDDHHQFLVFRQMTLGVLEMIIPAEFSDHFLSRRSNGVQFQTVQDREGLCSGSMFRVGHPRTKKRLD